MRKPEDGKKAYDEIKIPEQLEKRVDQAVRSMDKEASLRKHRARRRLIVFKNIGAAAAALVLCMTIGVNTSEVLAKEMGELPVIGALAKVLTIRSYHEQDENYDIRVNVPEIQLEESAPDSEEEAFVGDINAQIDRIVEEHVAQAKQKFEEYKEAFFATGGTEEEWNGRNMDVNVDYEVKYQKDNILSLVLTTDEGWVNAYGVRYYYNLDLKENRELTLKDLLGDDYVEIANESIKAQMEERSEADENAIYWGVGGKDDGMIEGFTTVDENTKFYINDKGNPVVCFEKYEVAPGYMGVQEFEIEK